MMVRENESGVEVYHRGDGKQFPLGLRTADMKTMRAAPQYAATYPTIPQDQWTKKGGGLADFMPFVWNQGNYGSCGGHGSVAAFTANWNFQFAEPGKSPYEFSPCFTYGMCNGGRDNGSVPEDLMKSLADDGVCLMSTVPEGDIYSKKFPDTAFAEAQRFRADQQLVIHTFEDVASAVIRRQAVYTGIYVGNNFNPDHNGRIARWDGRRVGGHCTAQIGELEYVDKVGWGVWTLNSWGRDFGLAGWVWLHRSFFDGGLPDFAGVAVASAVPDPKDTTPTPSPV